MEQHGDGALAGAGRAGRDASGGGRLRVLPRQCLLPYPLRIWAEVVARVWAAAVLGCSVWEEGFCLSLVVITDRVAAGVELGALEP